MKILRISSLGYESGGTETGLVLMKAEHERMGHEVRILTSNAGPEKKHFGDYEFEALDHHPLWLRMIYRLWYPASYNAVKQALEEFKPDVVSVHTMWQVSPSVLFLLKKHPSVMVIHGAEDFTPSLLLWSFPATFFKGGMYDFSHLKFTGWLHYFYYRFLSLPIYRVGLRNIDTCISFSAYMQKQLRRDSIETTYTPNATTLLAYTPIDSEGNLIVYAGRLEKYKGVDDLIRAFAATLQKNPQARLEIAGTGSYEDELKSLVKKLALEDRIAFLGHLTRAQLYELYKRSMCLVTPSTWPEPFGKVGVEAMSVGRPVIAADVGGISEWLVDGKVGYLVPPHDSVAIAEKLDILFSDRAQLLKMSLSAREHSEKFDMHTHAAWMIALYQSIIEKHKKADRI